MDGLCAFLSDVSPTGQGVDHRQVQRDLGEVAVQLQEPVMLTQASIRISWTVSDSSGGERLNGSFGSFHSSRSFLVIPFIG